MRIRALVTLVALLAPGLLLAGCGETREQPRNLVLVSVDTLRADHLGCYGYTRPTSPAIDALSKRGVLFEQTSSTGTWTVPAHMSMLTGQYAGAHGIDGWQKRLPDDIETLAERLKANGYATAAIVNVHLLNEERAFSRGSTREDIERLKKLGYF